jgi:hypothetical protein
MKYRNPVYNEYGSIDCEIEHPQFGWIPFTASDDDTEAHGKTLFNLIKKSGNIKDYVKPKISSNELKSIIRSERDLLLKETDWTQLPDVPESTKQKWAEYRQALRDVTDQPNFPQSVTWPTKPS